MTRKDRVRRHAMATAHTRREDNRTGVKRSPRLVLADARTGPVTRTTTRRKLRRLLTRASRKGNR